MEQQEQDDDDDDDVFVRPGNSDEVSWHVWPSTRASHAAWWGWWHNAIRISLVPVLRRAGPL
jgi:hypothetical protein